MIDKEQRDRSQREIESALRKRLDQIPGISYSITQGHFMGEEGDLIIYLYGEDLDMGKRLSNKIKEAIQDIPEY